MKAIKLQIDDNLTTEVTTLIQNVDENSIYIVIKDDLENECFQENLRNWGVQALYHGARTYTVFYTKQFRITL